MEPLRLLLYIVHMLAMLAIVVAPFVAGRVHVVQTWAARLQLLVGLGLVGILEAQDASLNHTKIGVKLLVMIAVVALAEIAAGKTKKGQDGRTLALAAAGLAVVNAVIAFVW